MTVSSPHVNWGAGPTGHLVLLLLAYLHIDLLVELIYYVYEEQIA